MYSFGPSNTTPRHPERSRGISRTGDLSTALEECSELANLHKQLPRLEISLEDARIYRARGGFPLASSTQARRFIENGEEPAPYPGG